MNEPNPQPSATAATRSRAVEKNTKSRSKKGRDGAKAKNTKRVNVRLDTDLFQRVAQGARTEQRSIAGQLTHLIKEGLNRPPTESQPQHPSDESSVVLIDPAGQVHKVTKTLVEQLRSLPPETVKVLSNLAARNALAGLTSVVAEGP
jgi:hypothetical protein